MTMKDGKTTMRRGGVWAETLVSLALIAAIVAVAFALFGRPARGDGLPLPPQVLPYGWRFR